MKLTYTAVLVSFNAEKTIQKAIDSVLNQSWSPIQIVVCDDNSSDNTWELIQNKTNEIPKVKTARLETNMGTAMAKNMAVQHSIGDIIIFFDDDDVSLSNRAEEHLRMHQIADISFVSSTKIYGQNYSIPHINNEKTLIPEKSEWIQKLILGRDTRDLKNLSIPCSTMAVKKTLFQALKGFDPELRRLEDVDFFLRSTEYKPLVSWTSKICVNRYHSDRQYKNRIIDINFERMLIDKNSLHFHHKQYNEAKILNALRGLYFSQKYFSFFMNCLVYFKTTIKYIGKSWSVLKRKLHEFRMRQK